MPADTSPTESGRSLDWAVVRKGATITAFVLSIIMPMVGLVLSVAAFI